MQRITDYEWSSGGVNLGAFRTRQEALNYASALQAAGQGDEIVIDEMRLGEPLAMHLATCPDSREFRFGSVREGECKSRR